MSLALLAAAGFTASWGPAARFSLVCTGTQTGYQERAPSGLGLGPAQLSIPWRETFTIDLKKGTYCSQGCALPEPISAVTATGVDLANVSNPGATILKRFTVAGGIYQSSEVTGLSSGGPASDRFHLEKSGTCVITP